MLTKPSTVQFKNELKVLILLRICLDGVFYLNIILYNGRYEPAKMYVLQIHNISRTRQHYQQQRTNYTTVKLFISMHVFEKEQAKRTS